MVNMPQRIPGREAKISENLEVRTSRSSTSGWVTSVDATLTSTSKNRFFTAFVVFAHTLL